MIAIQILAVGKIKDKWMREGCAEYQKRMGLWSKCTVTEIEEYRLPNNPSAAQIEECIEKEGERLAEKIPKGAHIIALCIEGKLLSSEELSDHLQEAAIAGSGAAVFVIGGSYGLSKEIKKRAALCLSMSRMTFPHQLARVLLSEQIYRALSIAANAKYHK